MVTAMVAGAMFLRALLRPEQATDGHSAPDHWRAAGIVARWGTDSLDPFALRQEKAFHFGYGGLLAYRTLRETAVVSGDPIGPPGCARSLTASFLAFAAQRGWDVVFTGVSERFLDEYRRLGLRALCIGQEAVVDPAGFSLDGRAIRKVRQSVTRAERRGWIVELAERVRAGDSLAAELERVESSWRGSRKRNHGFAMSLGRLWGSPEDDTAVYALGRRPDGELRAFVRFARAGDSLSLDVMRRSGDEPNGLNEALIARTLEWARDRGFHEVSLNFAGFAHLMASRAGLSGSQRVLRWAIGRVHGRFQLERLMTFNDKFRPAWRPRYLVYGARTHLPLAALRVLQAEAYIRPPRTTLGSSSWVPAGDRAEPTLVHAQPEGLR
jgi:lysyl-tRNA synthetase, class II